MALRPAWLPLLLLSACHGEPANIGGPGNWKCEDDCFLDSAAPPNAGSLFYGPEDAPESKPVVVYPLDGSTHPPNLPEITVQWRRSRLDQTLYRIRVESSSTRFDVYAPCFAVADGCRYSLPETRWLEISQALRGQDATLVVSGTDPLGKSVSHSEPVHLRFTGEDLTAGLYYWSAQVRNNDQRGTIMRLVFGERRADDFIEPESETNPYACGGCHAVSRNGTTIAYSARQGMDGGVSDQRLGHLVVSNVTTPKGKLIGPGSTYDCSMMALSPEGDLVLVSYDNLLELRAVSGDSPGQVLTTVTAANLRFADHGYFPEFSPDGTEVVLTLSNEPDSPHAVRSGTIAVLPFDPVRREFGMAEELVPLAGDGLYHFYPTWSPDGNWIAFVSAPIGAGMSGSYDQPMTRLRLVSRHDKNRVFDLGAATHAEGVGSTLPKFSPIPVGNPFFLTYSSKMDYGLLLRNSEHPDFLYPQLWMSVIDVERLEGAEPGSVDPSAAPVWLPFQEMNQRNHLGYWAEKVACIPPEPGEENPCGPDSYCDEALEQCIAIVK